MRTPYVSHPVGGHRQSQRALHGLWQIAIRLCILEDLFEKLHCCHEICSLQREVLRHDATCSLLQAHVSQALSHCNGLLGTDHPFLLLPHINREQKREIRQDVHGLCTRTITQQRQTLFERCPRLCSFILLPVGPSQPVDDPRKHFLVTFRPQPLLCSEKGALGLLLQARQEGCFTKLEQDLTTSSVLLTQQIQSRPIMGDGLFSGCHVQGLCRSPQRVIDASRLVATAPKMEGQRSQLVHMHGLLLPIASLKEATYKPVQASTPGGADFCIEALTNFVMGKCEGSCLLGSDKPSAYRLKQACLNHFHLRSEER